MNREERRKYQAAYRKKKGGQVSYSDRWAKKNPEKVKAHSKVASEKKSGARTAKKCSNCGSTKDVQVHHISYNPPKTKNLCARCHGATKRGK